MNLRRRILAGSAIAIAAALSAGAAGAATELMLLDQAQRDATLVALGFGFVVAVVTAFLLGRPVLRDLEQLASAANGIAAGDFETRSQVRRRDEIGVTATAFDEMATSLELLERERLAVEEERRLLVAGVSHDRRTPLAAISAALEAIDDGIGDPSARIAAARGDARALTLLVEDLFLLARVDAGRFVPPSRPVDLAEIVDEAAEALLPTAAAGGVNLVATNV
ncbi:MAG: HAMP domain-containing protein [Acidimicrobiales bacterium]|jgi:signal transduction histidine kinase